MKNEFEEQMDGVVKRTASASAALTPEERELARELHASFVSNFVRIASNAEGNITNRDIMAAFIVFTNLAEVFGAMLSSRGKDVIDALDKFANEKSN